MTNVEIIASHLEENGIDFEYTGNNLMTFAQWKRKGYSVKKGEKAFVKVDLWMMKKVKVENKDGEEEEEKKFFLKQSFLFKADQVQKIEKKKGNKKKVA